MSLWLIAALIFVTVFLALAAVVLFFMRPAGRLERRLAAARESESRSKSGSPSGDLGPNLFLINQESFYGLRARLVHANYRGRHSVFWYYVVRLLFAVAFAPVGYQVARLLKYEGPGLWVGAVAMALLGSAIPSMWVNERVSRRRDAIRNSTPNVLDLIIVCVEAGLSLNAAIQRIAQDMRYTYPELSRELAILNQEIFIGRSRSEAFRNLAHRTGVDELRSLAIVLMQSDKMGTGIAEVLRVQAQSLRTRQRQLALEAAHKMPVKLAFPLVLCIFPELMIVLLGPGMIQFYRTLTDAVK